MKSIIGFRWILIFAGLLVFAGACNDDDADDTTDEDINSSSVLTDLEGREITVAVENAYPPFNYFNAETGEGEGWDYDILAELCERLNCVPMFVPMLWETTLETVGRGDIDMIASGVVITDERDRIVDFSDSNASAYQYLFVRNNESRFSGAGDISEGDYVIAAQADTVNSEKAGELVGDERVITFPILGDAVAAVVNGEADAFIHLLREGQELTGQGADQVMIAGEPLAQLDYGFVFSEGSDLVAAFNEAIAALKADGTFYELDEQYFGPSFSLTPEDTIPPTYG